MPSPVDKYYKEVKDSNPDYSEEQAWATAWSIYCKHKNPGSEHCSKPPSEYLKGKEAGLLFRVASRHLEAMEHSSPEALKDYLHDHPNADPKKHHVKEKSKEDDFKDKVQPLEKKLSDKVKGWGPRPSVSCKRPRRRCRSSWRMRNSAGTASWRRTRR